MKKRMAFYRDRDGKEIDEHEAFEDGVLKDGVTLSVPTAMRDSLTPLQRAVAANSNRPVRVTDGFNGEAGRRPGYAIVARRDVTQRRWHMPIMIAPFKTVGAARPPAMALLLETKAQGRKLSVVLRR